MKIVELRAENVKRLRAVTIRPDGNIVVIGGNNANGKTSVLDSIAMALGGKDAVPAEPVRRGASKASVVVELDDLIVKRTFKADGGTYLTVEGRDGQKFPSPQAMLDKLVGSLSFDPLEFTRMDARKQLQSLRAVVGLDFSDLDERRATLYEERTVINRQLKSAEGALSHAPHHPGVPKLEVNVSELLKQIQQASADNLKAQKIQNDYRNALNEEQRLESVVAELKRQLALAESDLSEVQQAIEANGEAASRATFVDTAPLEQHVREAEVTNQKVRQNANQARLRKERDDLNTEADRLTAAIEEVDHEKAEMLAAAKFPVAGLTFDDSCVKLNGLPFSQASAAEQLRVSVAMGLALNPKLRVLLVRDGSLLDENSLAMVAAMAADADAQVWIERVGSGDEVSVIIEDGAVREPVASAVAG